MKRLLQLTLALLALGSLYATACPDKKFLNMLKKKDAAAVLTTVDTTSTFTICSEVWKTDGSCCAQDKIKTIFDDTMVKNVKGGFDKFIGSLKNVGMALNKIMKSISNKDDATAKFTAAFSANSTQFNGMTVAQAVDALGYSKMFKEDAEKFKTSGKDCFNATVTAAGKVFCYLCSGAAPTAEQTDGSTSVTQESCNALLDKCHHTWKFMHAVGGMMQAVSILNAANKTDAPKPKVQDKPGFGGVKLSDIGDAFKNCNASLTDAACTNDNKAVLCKAHFNVMAPPKRASDENMQPANTEALPAARLLQTATESTGDIGVAASGLDLTKTITTPTTTASVDSASANTGTSSANLIFGSIFSIVGLYVLLN